VDVAIAGQPQTIARHGRPAGVVTDTATYDAFTSAHPSFVDCLLAQPTSPADTEELFGRVRAELRVVTCEWLPLD
jgi:hypothetical protein